MIPGKQHTTWRALITGQRKHDFKCVPAGLMVSRITRDYAKKPGAIDVLVDELHAFFTKFEPALKDDLPQLFGK